MGNGGTSKVTEAHRKWVQVLGVKGAAAAGTKAKAASKGKAATIDFEPDVIEVAVAKGLPGDSGGEQMIKDQLTLFQTYIGDYWSNYTDGITKFTNRMNFSSEEEAEPKYLDAVFTAVCKKALDIALGEVGKKLGGHWGEMIDLVKAAAEAYVAESERAAKAAGEVKIVKFINGLIDGIGKGRDAMRVAVEKGKRPMIEEYQALAKKDNLKGKVTPDGRVIGEAARIVTGVQERVEAFRKALPSASYFQQQFARAFADTPGRTDLVSHGGIEAGKLYFEIHLVLDEDGGKRKWSIDEDGTSDAWKLVTLAPRPERVAASLQESLAGKKPWQIDLDKKVMLRVEVEEFGPNPYHDGWIFFKNSPDTYTMGAFTDPKLAAEAWGLPMTRSRVLNTMKMVGSNK